MIDGEKQEVRPVDRAASLESDFADVWAGVATEQGVMTVYVTSIPPGLGDRISSAAGDALWRIQLVPAARRELHAVRDRLWALRDRIGPFQASLDIQRGLVVLTTGRGSHAQQLVSEAARSRRSASRIGKLASSSPCRLSEAKRTTGAR